MKRKEVLRQLKYQTGISMQRIGDLLDQYTEIIREEVTREGKCRVVGLGTLRVSETKEHMGWNPNTKEPMLIKSSKTVQFRPTPIFKEMVQEGPGWFRTPFKTGP